MTTEKILGKVKLTEEQKKEGYWVEQSEDNVLVWHQNNQIALLYNSPDINHKVQEVVERNSREKKGKAPTSLE